MILTWLTVLLHLASAIIITLYCLKPKRLSDLPAETLLTFFVSFYGLPIFIGWTSGYINLYTIFISCAISCAFAALCFFNFKHTSFHIKDIKESIRYKTILEKILIASILVILSIICFLGTVLPIRIYDAVCYHSLNPLRWATTGKFVIDTFGDPKISSYITVGEVFPNVKGILPFLVMYFTKNVNGTALTQFPFLLILISSFYAILRRLNFSAYSSLIGVLFCLVAPEVFLQSIEAYADLVFFAGQIAVLFICLMIWQDESSCRNTFLAASAFSLLAGAKPTGLLMCGALGIIFLFLQIYKSKEKTFSAKFLNMILSLFAVLLLSLMIAGPWYINAIKKFKNPVYPFKFQIGNKTVFDGPYPQDSTNVQVSGRQKAIGVKAWWNMMNESHKLPSISSWSGGFGAHTIILGIPSFLLFLILIFFEKNKKNFLIILLSFLMMFLATPVLLWARFSLFQIALFAVAFSFLIDFTTRFPRIILISLFILLSSFNLYRTLPAIAGCIVPPEAIAYPIITGNTRGMQNNFSPDQYTTLDFWREHLCEEGMTLALTKANPYQALNLKKSGRVIRVFDYASGDSPETYRDYLESLGATHLYATRTSANFNIAISNPELYKLLIHRIDCGSESCFGIFNDEESALFEILSKD